MKKILTIVVPAFNVENTIKDSISSFGNLLNNADVEIIIVNDASSDNTGNIVENLIQYINNIVYIKNAVNKGVSFSRNVGLRNAHGEYVTFFDPDDKYTSVLTDTVIKVLRARQPNILIFGFDKIENWSAKSGDRHWINTNEQGDIVEVNRDYILEDILDSKDNAIAGYTHNKVFRKAVLGDMEFKSMIYEDFPFFLESVLKTTEKIEYYNVAGLLYMQWPNSQSHLPNEKRLMDRLDSFRIVREMLLNTTRANDIIHLVDMRELPGVLWVAKLNCSLKSKNISRMLVPVLRYHLKKNSLNVKTTLKTIIYLAFNLYKLKIKR